MAGIRDLQVDRQIADVNVELAQIQANMQKMTRLDQDVRRLNLRFRYLMDRLEHSWGEDRDFSQWLAELDVRMIQALTTKHDQLAQQQEHLAVKQHNLNQQAQRLAAEQT